MPEEAIIEEAAVVETAPESEAPAESVETEAAVTPTDVPDAVPKTVEADAPIPAWFTNTMSRSKRKNAAAAAAEEKAKREIPEGLRDSIVDEDAFNYIMDHLDSKTEAVRAESRAAKSQADEIIRKQNEKAVLRTHHHVYNSVYCDKFKNDPTLMGNKDAAEFADRMVHEYMDRATWDAMEHSDTSSLDAARDPNFGAAVAALAKVKFGLKDGNVPVSIKGAEVASSSGVSGGKSDNFSSVYSKADIAAAQSRGITEAQLRKAHKATGSSTFDEYDS